ncbi:MAG: hypothetical protein HC933_12420 [Pleurocapsa sp. SU_196_0]|nr:hypothetical protein [Pleurocapsa sp. SU_196_0]
MSEQMKVFDFGAGQIEVALIDGEVAIQLVRLAEALGVDRQGIHQQIQRDEVLQEYLVNRTLTREGNLVNIPLTREGNLVNETLTTGEIPRPTTFLKRPGVLGVMMKLSAKRIRDPERRAKLQAFQRWAYKHLDATLFGSPPSPELVHRIRYADEYEDMNRAASRVIAETLSSFTREEIQKLSVPERLKLLHMAVLRNEL